MKIAAKNLFLMACLTLLAARQTSWLSHLRDAGRKAATGLDSVLKTREETVPTLLDQETESRLVSRGYEYQKVRFKPETKVLSTEFFTRYASDLKLGNDDAFEKVISFPNKILPDRTRNVIRYRQRYKGLPVLGTGYALQTDGDDQVLAGTGKFVANLSLDTAPTLTESEALEAAKKAVPAKVYSWDQDPKKYPKGTLAIGFKDKMKPSNARLVYQFDITSKDPDQSFKVNIDARTGEVLAKTSNFIPSVPEWNQNVPCNFISEGVKTSFDYICDLGADGKYRLMCKPTGTDFCLVPVKTIDKRRPNPQAHPDEDDQQDYAFTDDNDNGLFAETEIEAEDPGIESWDEVGAYEYWVFYKSLRFYQLRFNWLGFDGAGTGPVSLYVKPNSYLAYYTLEDDSITIDPKSLGYQGMTHEMTHGVIFHAVPGIVYDGIGETSALNEGFAEILGVTAVTTHSDGNLGTCCDGFADPHSVKQPKTYQGYYYVGQTDCGTAGGYCYHTPDNTTVACGEADDYCHIAHSNAWVQQYMYYCLANGCSGVNDPPLSQPYKVQPIGNYRASQIAFQTIIARLSPTSTYAEARDAWIAAAEDLYGKDSEEVRETTNAWNAVGVGDAFGTDVSHQPASGEQNVPPWPATLEWEPPEGEYSWQVQVSTSPDFEEDVHIKETYAFSVSSPDLPDLGLDSGETDQGLAGRQTGSGVFSSPDSGSSDSSAVAKVTINLETDMDYYWRVRTKTAASTKKRSILDDISNFFSDSENTEEIPWGDWGPIYNFKTDTRMPVLTSPKSASTESGKEGTSVKGEITLPTKSIEAYPWNPEFKFKTVDGGNMYFLKVSETAELEPGKTIAEGISNTVHATKTGTGTTSSGTGDTTTKVIGGTHTRGTLNEGSASSPIDNGPPDLDGDDNEDSQLPSVNPLEPWVDPKDPDYQDGSDGLKFTLNTPLKIGSTYYWGAQSYRQFERPKTGEKESITGDWSNDGEGQAFETSTPQAELKSPDNGDKLNPWDITLKCKETQGAVGYIVRVSKDLSCVQDLNCADNLYTGADLTDDDRSAQMTLPVETQDNTYYWTVLPKGPSPYNETGLAAEPRSFTLDAEATKTTLVYPSNGWYVAYKDPDMHYTWSVVESAEQYRLTVYSKNSDGTPGSEVYSNTFAASEPDSNGYLKQSFTNVGNTDKNGYCWTVQALGPGGSAGLVSDTWCYSLRPDTPVLLTPTEDATGVDYKSVTFTWNSEWAPEGYYIAVTEGSSAYTGDAVAVSGKSYTKVLAPDKTYSWMVRAPIDPDVDLSYSSSSTWSFKTKGCDPMTAPVYLIPSGTSTCESPAPATYSVSTQWGAVSGAVQYEVALYRFPNASSNDFNTTETVVAPTYTTGTSWGSATVSTDVWYGWTVRAQNSCGEWGPVTPYYFTNFICFYQ